jgi:hypothetical protein
MAVHPIAINHPTVTALVRANHAHGHMARRLRKAAAGNGSGVTEFRAARESLLFRTVLSRCGGGRVVVDIVLSGRFN